ncbi:MAG: hypothetical protein ACYDGR_05365 [Candidatus Dormibacteria bacterium]
MKVRWARAATKHRISRSRSQHVIQHSGSRIRLRAGEGGDDRLVYLGDDGEGTALEVIVVELSDDEVLVIHAMPLRPKYRADYEEAIKWRI